MGMFALASAWLVVRDRQREALQTRWGLAAALAFKALIAFATALAISQPELFPVTPPTTFMVLILCQFAIAMFVLILVQERAEKRLIALTETDSLTGIRNRHWMMDRLPRLALAGSALVIIDIDHFKQINDRFGHAAGDQVLIAVAQTMAASLGEDAIFARMGGEEFSLCLHASSEAAAIAKAEMLRLAVEGLRIAHEGDVLAVTLSAGVSLTPDTRSMSRLVARADEALYAAKGGGRNRIAFLGFGNEEAAAEPMATKASAQSSHV
jgi:diguanylate cyclase (GGDEF)-like protein